MQSRRISKVHDTLMSDESKKERRKKIRKQMSVDSAQEGDAAYPTSKLTRQTTVATSNPSSSSSSSSSASKDKTTKTNKQKSSSTSSVPPPPQSQPPEPQSQPVPKRSGNRGALLGSIEGFSKGKLRKSVCNDRSAPKL